MKKCMVFVLLLALCVMPAALAQDSATALPMGVTFEMDGPAVAQAVGGSATYEPYSLEDDPDTGYVEVENVEISGLNAAYLTYDIQRNNSAEQPRLSMINATLDVGDNCIADFRTALEALTAAYGQPDNDPFDAQAVESYVEFGGLEAYWTKADVRISLYMQRMYSNTLSVSFSSRVNYDAEDLK